MASVAVPTTQDDSTQSVYVASQWKLVWWRFRRHRLAIIGTVIVGILYLVALFPEFLATHDPHERNAKKLYLSPTPVRIFDGWLPRPYVNGLKSERNPDTLALDFEIDYEKKYRVQYFVRGYEYKMLGLITTDWHLMGLDTDDDLAAFHMLGTDRMGRDLWSRLMLATRISMSVGLLGVLISLFLGILLGGLSGYYSGWMDVLIQRLIEFLRSIPTIPLWIALAAAVPRDWSVVKVYFAITVLISFIGWTTLAREVRGRFLVLREDDFVVAARVYGSSPLRTIFRHMVPNFISHIIATTTLAIPTMIIAETSLSFLGLGLKQPVISWGVLLFEAQQIRAVASAPWLLVPGLFVLLSVLAFNFMGDGLRGRGRPILGTRLKTRIRAAYCRLTKHS